VSGGALFKRVMRNERGRDLIVGDVHGHFTKLQRALDAAGFEPAAGDRLFSVGDLVNRGPESGQVLQWLNETWFHAVQGNHEAWAVAYHRGVASPRVYAAHGGARFIDMIPAQRQAYVDAFEALPLGIELDTPDGLLGIVHADLPLTHWRALEPALQMASSGLRHAALVDSMQWGRDRAEGLLCGEVADVRAVVVGHTPMERITSFDNVLFIDTGAWLPRGGEFALIDAVTLVAA
jgi:serine/threonine protein phosphatase 1